MRAQLTYRLKRLNRSLRARLCLFSSRFDALGAPSPLLKLEYAAHKESRTLIIFLPGIDDLAEDFERRGFIHELRRAGVAADAIAVDAHFGYYARRVILERVTEDVIASAHASGYEEIWLVGISLGGFGAASYAARHPSHVNGVLLLAPYLGDKPLIDEIVTAGGLDAWDPGQVTHADYPRSLWSWLKRHPSMPGAAPPIYLGYGTGDAFARANALLADVLPERHVFAISGRHDWHTWMQIWRMFLGEWGAHRR
ncbi:MAG TPA: alpha/beta hydrolase [Noviherbaspirillum sp.]|nr:alpha/beta hydrolase [Noviherbaspirillum sp.]